MRYASNAEFSTKGDRCKDVKHASRIASNSNTPWPLVCSVCDGALSIVGRVLRCEKGHTFDIAKEGYVNLLTAKHAERGITGDTRPMLRARRRFLEAGYFASLLEQLEHQVDQALNGIRARRCVVEVGCGEGYYIGNLSRAAASGAGDTASYIGLDVSKEATRLAARRYPEVQFAVANVRRRVYIASETTHVLLSIFAPRNVEEFRRIIAPEGRLIIVFPSRRHMEEIRSRFGLLQVEEDKEDRVLTQFSECFALQDRQTLEYAVTITGEHVRDFINMGPNAWHTQAAAVDAEETMETRASFVILQFVPRV